MNSGGDGMFKRGMIVGATLLLVFTALWIVREGKHYMHYCNVGTEGKLKADIVRLSVNATENSEAILTATIKNSGTQAWVQSTNYFALGVFERNPLGRRVEVLQFSNGTNRVIVSKEIRSGEVWEVSTSIKNCPDSALHFQMVQEGITWFGQEKSTTAIRIQAASP